MESHDPRRAVHDTRSVREGFPAGEKAEDLPDVGRYFHVSNPFALSSAPRHLGPRHVYGVFEFSTSSHTNPGEMGTQRLAVLPTKKNAHYRGMERQPRCPLCFHGPCLCDGHALFGVRATHMFMVVITQTVS